MSSFSQLIFYTMKNEKINLTEIRLEVMIKLIYEAANVSGNLNFVSWVESKRVESIKLKEENERLELFAEVNEFFIKNYDLIQLLHSTSSGMICNVKSPSDLKCRY